MTCCEEWLNFQNFAQWYRDNYYEIEGERVALDKDILVKGNKIYSKESCIFVPQRINSLFVNTSASRGKYPIGISIVNNKYFQVLCNDVEGNCKYIGRYSSIEEAFNNYKNFKEGVIKEVADKYKYKIPNKLYNAMYNYNIEITD